MRRKLVPVVKVLIVAAILGWLFSQNQEAIRGLWVREKNVKYLALAWLSMLAAVCLSFVRWFLLVRGLEIRFTLPEAFRYGFIGYLFNFVGPSAVGGDLFKAYLLARNQTERRLEAVATILLDRIVGFFSLLLVVTSTIFVSKATQIEGLGELLQSVTWITGAATFGVFVLLLPGRYTAWLTARLTELPFVGTPATRVMAALELYRNRLGYLALALIVSITSHVCIALTVRFADLAVHPITPNFLEHMIISPLSSVAAAAPLPGGMGTFELTMDYLFAHLPSVSTADGQGFSVAMIYRLVTVCVAIVGVIYYFANRSMVRQISAEVTADT